MPEPSRTELIVIWFLSLILFCAVILHFGSFVVLAATSGDNISYIKAAEAIRHWNFTGIEVKQFWGLPYAMAAVSRLSGASSLVALLLVCWTSSLLSVLLTWKLWGGWVAGFFAILNFDWLQRSYLGGAEPFFAALLFSSFWMMRRERWVGASVLAALATLVRPVGALALVALGIVLLWRHDYRKLFCSAGVAGAIGALYLLPFWVYLHDPFYQIHRYKAADWQSGSAIGLPFAAIGISIVHNQEPLTNLALTVGWVLFVLLGTIAMCRRGFRSNLMEHKAEYGFAFLYVAFLFTYNSAHWARAEFPRFAIPVLPFILLSLKEWIPKRRILLYGMGLACTLLAACSAIGIRYILSGLH